MFLAKLFVLIVITKGLKMKKMTLNESLHLHGLQELIDIARNNRQEYINLLCHKYGLDPNKKLEINYLCCEIGNKEE
jgi:hypothetical protein